MQKKTDITGFYLYMESGKSNLKKQTGMMLIKGWGVDRG